MAVQWAVAAGLAFGSAWAGAGLPAGGAEPSRAGSLPRAGGRGGGTAIGAPIKLAASC